MIYIKPAFVDFKNYEEIAKKITSSKKAAQIRVETVKAKDIHFKGFGGGTKKTFDRVAITTKTLKSGYQPKSKTTLSKKDVGNQMAKAMTYANRKDRNEDEQEGKDYTEDDSQIYSGTERLSKEQLNELRYKLNHEGVEHFRSIIISPEDNYSREELEHITKSAINHFNQTTGKTGEYYFAIHTNTDHAHVHLNIESSKRDGNWTQSELQLFKIYTVESMKEVLDNRDKKNDLQNEIERMKEHHIKLLKSEEITAEMYKERVAIDGKETVQQQLKFKELHKDTFDKEDLLKLAEIKKLEGYKTNLERQNPDKFKNNLIEKEEKFIKERTEKFGAERFEKLSKIIDSNEINDYKKAMLWEKKLGNQALTPNADMIKIGEDLKKAEAWKDKAISKLSDDDKAFIKTVSLSDLNNYQYIQDKQKILDDKKKIPADEEHKKKIGEVDSKIQVLKDGIKDKEIEEKFKEAVNAYTDGLEAKRVHIPFSKERGELFIKTGQEIENAVGWKDYANKFAQRYIESDQTINFSPNKALEGMVKNEQELKAEIEAIKNANKSIDKNTIEELKKLTESVQRPVSDEWKTNSTDTKMFKAKAQKIGVERNELKQNDSISGTESQLFRDKQREFMNVKFVENNGFSKQSLEAYFEDKTIKPGEKQSKDKIYTKENAEQSVKNNIAHAEELVKAGYLKQTSEGEYKFTDERSREILFNNAEKGNDLLAEINKKDLEKHLESEKERIQNKVDSLRNVLSEAANDMKNIQNKQNSNNSQNNSHTNRNHS